MIHRMSCTWLPSLILLVETVVLMTTLDSSYSLTGVLQNLSPDMPSRSYHFYVITGIAHPRRAAMTSSMPPTSALFNTNQLVFYDDNKTRPFQGVNKILTYT